MRKNFYTTWLPLSGVVNVIIIGAAILLWNAIPVKAIGGQMKVTLRYADISGPDIPAPVPIPKKPEVQKAPEPITLNPGKVTQEGINNARMADGRGKTDPGSNDGHNLHSSVGPGVSDNNRPMQPVLHGANPITAPTDPLTKDNALGPGGDPKNTKPEGDPQGDEDAVVFAAKATYASTAGYPKDASNDGREGTVVIRVNVDENGRGVCAISRSSGYDDLNSAALKAAQRSVYKAAETKKGRLVEGTVTLIYTFANGKVNVE